MQPADRTPRSRAAVATAVGSFAPGHLWRQVAYAAADGGRGVRRLLATEVERRRLFLWLPVFFGGGILLYFAADREPALWAPVGAAGGAGAAAVILRRHWRTSLALVALAALFAGFAAATWRSQRVAAPTLARIVIATLSGFVESVEARPQGPRIVVAVTALTGVDDAARPRRVRVTLRPGASVRPGDFIEAKARLMPPPEPARPGGYDFAREAFFRGIGAVGSISGALTVRAPPAPPDAWLAMAARIDAARNALTERIARAFGGQAGAVAAALVTGKRGLITEDTNDALRAAGIYHIVSISGLHMVLAAGTVFWGTRAVLALVPGLALMWPLKKLAAVVAMLAATAYCIFSGSEVATERSLIMTLVMLGAILVDRPALSMRNLAIAALLVLAREPETLLGPSFQMSFAAVAGLIGFAEWSRQAHEPAARSPAGPVLRAGRAAARAGLALIVTTLVASLATAPFSAYHFQALNPFGVLGNALALPFVSLAVMPLAVLGTVAYPFGLDWPLWWLMGAAAQPVLAAADTVAGLERANTFVPAFGAGALGLFAAAILLATAWTTALRFTAAVPAVLALFAAAAAARPDVVVDRTAAGAAVRTRDGRLSILGRPSGFVVEQWLRADGDGRAAGDSAIKDGARCDRLGCVATLPDGRAVALVTDRRAFAEDCRRAALVISRLAAPATCRAPLILDRDRLAAAGATAVFVRGEDLVLAHARDPAVMRPWLRGPPPTAARAAPGATPPVPASDGRVQQAGDLGEAADDAAAGAQ